MDPHAKKKLREKVEQEGLVEPLVWNERTGYLVGGHQRLMVLDELEGTPNYVLTVAVVDLDPAQERALNVWLNNPAVQGQFDYGKLEVLFREFETNPFESGFERLDLELMFPEDTVERLLTQFAPPEVEPATDSAPVGIPGQAPAAEDVAEKIRHIKELRKEWVDQSREDFRADHIAVIVFESAADASTYLRQLGLDEFQTFIAADRFTDAARAYYQQGGEASDPAGVDSTANGRPITREPLPGPVDPPRPSGGAGVA